MIKNLLILFTLLFIICTNNTLVFANTNAFNSSEIAFCDSIICELKTDVDEELIPTLSIDILFLSEIGFEKEEIILLDIDIRQVATLIRARDMSEEEIEELKNGFINSRPTDPAELASSSYGMSFEEAGIYGPQPGPKSVTVVLPTFPVTINGQLIESVYNQYPLLLYEGITYFPMAYNYAAFMGIKSNWYKDTRILFIGISGNTMEEYKPYLISPGNQETTYTAIMPDYDIAVNTVDRNNFLRNENEEYPLLNFRNITYFPLTWRFAVDEFGWSYSFDNEGGLRIDSENTARPVIDDSILNIL